ncbi:hypothetical protein [Listeria seeligeri]|uniref:hypothetical protein n=1 Tax=Listeria seeligeri TaxID=1640 RepID=UPI001624E6E6|nr:hypothetical protein [Listeria seeligeri]MBC1746917.1 hypothetical protein [Listeria seeligeri]MBC2233056.1 hypothetical protein [Listeria seeligeri]MBF2626114.1 hypothetical protein [Listeria seeligeri]MBF2673492.1 hypothetical protein [Listeria seeligeri]
MLERQVKPKEMKDTQTLIKLYFESQGMHPEDGLHQLYKNYLDEKGIVENMAVHLRREIELLNDLHQAKQELQLLQKQIGGHPHGISEET